jgi:penicillin-binding protein 1C
MEADSPGAVAQLSWFVDGRFAGTVAADQRLWWTPSPGVHEFLVMDELGLSSRRRLEVQVRR